MGQLRIKVWVEIIGADGVPRRREIAIIDRSVDGVGLEALDFSLADGKAIRGRLKEELTQFQVDQASQHD